jgi:hypothetical protein
MNVSAFRSDYLEFLKSISQKALLENWYDLESAFEHPIIPLLNDLKEFIPWMKNPELQTEEMKLFLSLKDGEREERKDQLVATQKINLNMKNFKKNKNKKIGLIKKPDYWGEISSDIIKKLPEGI